MIRIGARALAASHVFALLVGLATGLACDTGYTIRASFGGFEVELEPPVARKLEGLTAEERRLVLLRGMTVTECPEESQEK